jgi:glutathione S-transferase
LQIIYFITSSIYLDNMKPVFVYGVAPSGNSQKAILGCQLMNVPYELRVVPNLIGKEAEVDGSAKSPAYLRMNPRGTVPVLVDPNSPSEPAAQYGLDGEVQSEEGLVVNESAAILTYLALKYNPTWYNVNNPIVLGRINNWLAFAANEVHHSLLKVI